MRNVLLKMLLTALVLVSCAKATPTEARATETKPVVTSTKTSPTVTSDDQRIEMKKRWIAAAELVYAKTHNPDARVIIDVLLQNLVTVKPTASGPMVLEDTDPEAPWSFFLNILPEDRGVHPQIQELLDVKAIAQYLPESRMIIVQELVPCSETWKGLILLHEGHHAGDIMFTPYDSTDPKTFSEKERGVHEFQNRMMAAIGGEAYTALLKREVIRLRSESRRAGKGPFVLRLPTTTMVSVPGRTEYYPELDTIFGPALSQLEKDLRQTHFWVDAVFLALEEDQGEGPQAQADKASFLRTVYTVDGILPSS